MLKSVKQHRLTCSRGGAGGGGGMVMRLLGSGVDWGGHRAGAGGCLYSLGEEEGVEVAVDWSSAHDPVHPLPPSVGVVEEALPHQRVDDVNLRAGGPAGHYRRRHGFTKTRTVPMEDSSYDKWYKSDVRIIIRNDTMLYVLLRNRLVIEWGEGRSMRESGRHRTLDRFRRWTAAST